MPESKADSKPADRGGETSKIKVRPFRGSDTPGLLQAWARALPFDVVTLDAFERKVLLDANYEADGLLVATQLGKDEIIGFAACFVLNRPIEKVGHREDTGYISMFGVVPGPLFDDAAGALLDSAEAFFRARGRSVVLLSPYTPNYFVPGIDKERYPELIAFLQARGFVEFSEALAADAAISTFSLSAEVLERERALTAEGIEVRPFRRADLVEYLAFQRAEMPGPWVEDTRYYLTEMTHGRFPEDAIWIAVDKRATGGGGADANSGAGATPRIIGFCMHDHEHFGPFGVIDGYQERGVGTVLLARTLHQMRVRGCHSAWVLWTGERALKGVYGRLGFTLTRRFAVLKKQLS